MPANGEVRNLGQAEGERLGEGRYLLFDSGCGECSEIAVEIEREAEGWLKARSLKDPGVTRKLAEARPDWEWEPTLLEIKDDKAFAFTGMAMKMRLLVGLGPRRTARVARIVFGGKGSGFDVTISSSEDNPDRYIVESVKRIDRLTALKTLGALGMAATFLPFLPQSVLAQSSKDAQTSAVARIRTVNLAPQQAINMFNSVRKNNSNVQRLYADLTAKGFTLLRDQTGGAVMNTFAADGTSQGRSTVLILQHSKADGQRANFQVSISGAQSGGGGETASRITSEYAIIKGNRVEAYTFGNGRVSLVKKIDDVEAYRDQAMKNASSQTNGTSRVAAQASRNCTICTRAGATILGLGCSVGSAAAVLAACVPFGPACPLILSAFYFFVCSGFTYLSAPQVCENIGYC